MTINQGIFKAYDIRGIYPQELNEEIVSQIAKAVFTFLAKQLGKTDLSLVVGADMRLSSPSLSEAVKQALVESGATVVDIGLASTPTFYFAVSHFGCDGGIQVSASHNPKQYNGFKLVKNTPKGLIKIGKTTGMEEVKKITLSGQFIKGESEGKILEKGGVLEEEVKKTFEIVKPGQIRELKIVADAANSMGSLYLDALFGRLPGQLIRMNFELDGTFPAHQPDPLQFKTLVDLQKRVVEEGAALGIAPDGDGDRVFFIDEEGKVIPASHITALMIRELLKKYPGEKMVFDVRYIKTPQKATLDGSGIAVITKVGHALITETMHQENALFAGESSGHYFFRETGFAESPMPVILTVLDVISREAKPISQVLKPLCASVESGEINFKFENPEVVNDLAETLKRTHKEGKISTLDGLSIEYSNWRFNLRSSNTEPLVRLNIEADSEELLTEKIKEIQTFIMERGGSLIK